MRPLLRGCSILTLNAKLLKARTLVIEGTVDLPDGTVIDFDLQHSGMMRDPDPTLKFTNTQGQIKVTGGRYATSVDLAGWKPGTVEVWIGIDNFIPKQPAGVMQRFGPNDNDLSGPSVVDKKILKRIEATKTILLPSLRPTPK